MFERSQTRLVDIPRARIENLSSELCGESGSGSPASVCRGWPVAALDIRASSPIVIGEQQLEPIIACGDPGTDKPCPYPTADIVLDERAR